MIKNNEICEKYKERLRDIIAEFNMYRDEITNGEQIETVLKNPVIADKLFTEEGYDEEQSDNVSDFLNNLQKAMAFEKCKEMKSAFRRLFWVYMSMVMPIVAENEEQIPACLKPENVLIRF